MRIFLKIVFILLLISSHLGFSYYYFDGWWYSSIGTVSILLFSYLVWKKEFLIVTGLKISLKTVLKVVVLAILIFFVSILIVRYIGSRIDVEFELNDPRTYFHIGFYVLNEEIVLGGITLYFLIKRLKINPLIASVGLALFFSLVHFVFYKWIFLQTGQVTFEALTTLILIGFVRNNLILQYRHIGYSWALHFGWSAVMLGSHSYWINTHSDLTEPERFNIFLGSIELLVISGILAVLSMIFMLRAHKNTDH